MIDTILAHLESVTRHGDYWTAKCPCHDDDKPSLSVSMKEGRVLLKCHAGCDQDALIGKLRDMGAWPKAQEGAAQTLHEEYVYQNEDGSTRYTVIREAGKKFRVKTEKGWGLQGVSPVLYRLPKVTASKAVVVVEGERDVHTVERLGLVGTTNPFGAGKWGAEFAAWLKGKRVVVIPDNDKPGHEHAEKVCQSLVGMAESTRVVELPVGEKGDITDWVSAGGTREELLALIKAAPEWSDAPNEHLVRVSDVESREVEFLWRPYVPIGKITLIDGDPGVGKSFLTQALATGISLGYGIPGGPYKPGNVLLCSCEDDVDDTIRPRLETMRADLSRILAYDQYFALDADGFLHLESLIRQAKPAAVFLDPLVSYFGAKMNMNHANETRRIMAGLADIAKRCHCAVIGIRHLRKETGKSKAIYSGTGSIDILGASRSVMLVSEEIEAPEIRVIRHIKCNVERKGDPLYYTIREGAHFRWLVDNRLYRPWGGFDYDGDPEDEQEREVFGD